MSDRGTDVLPSPPGFLVAGPLDDGAAPHDCGRLDDALLDELLRGAPPVRPEPPGELVVRNGLVVRLVPRTLAPEVPEDWLSGAADPWWPDGDSLPVDPLLTDPMPADTPGDLAEASKDVLAEVACGRLSGTPGPELARLVAEAIRPDRQVLGGLPDESLSDLVVACGRLQSWAAGVQALVVAERAARETHPLAHASLVGQVTAELVVTQAEGAEVVVRGESGADHPAVVDALLAGRIDVRKAQTLLRSATQLTTAERAEAIDRYLPQAPHRTWRWLQSKMLAFAKARHGAEQAAEDAARQRTVQIDRADNDMAWLTAYLPAPHAAAVWGVVDDMAHQLRRAPGEERTLAQLRADSLTGIVTGRLVPAAQSAGTGAGAGASASTGTTGTGRPPGLGGDAGVMGDVPGPDCSCGGRAPVVQQVVRVTPSRPVIRVTVPASTLLGLDDAPGNLAGYGPIPAATARTIATDATWRRLLTDPVTGILTDYSTTTYQPGAVLRGAVQARDETCTFPGCEVPATRCDLDHITPYDHQAADGGRQALPLDAPGQTRAGNLHALCRRHHLLKTHAGWGVERDSSTGITTWTAPTGGAHSRPPTALDTHADTGQIDPETSYDLTLRALARAARSRSARSRPTPPGSTQTFPVLADPVLADPVLTGPVLADSAPTRALPTTHYPVSSDDLRPEHAGPDETGHLDVPPF